MNEQVTEWKKEWDRKHQIELLTWKFNVCTISKVVRLSTLQQKCVQNFALSFVGWYVRWFVSFVISYTSFIWLFYSFNSNVWLSPSFVRIIRFIRLFHSFIHPIVDWISNWMSLLNSQACLFPFSWYFIRKFWTKHLDSVYLCYVNRFMR